MEDSGLVFDIKRYSINDGPGIRTTVFLKGCPLTCTWCHNPESQSADPEVYYRRERCLLCGDCAEACPVGAARVGENAISTDLSLCLRCGICCDNCPADARQVVGRRMTVQEVLEVLLKDQVFYEESGGGATFSGGEPLVQSRFLVALLKACQEVEINRVVDTSGFASPTVLLEVARHTNLFLFDLKHMDSEKHCEHTGVKNDRILDNLRMISEAGSQISVRIPVIAGFNSDLENLRATAQFLRPLQGITEVCLLPFHTAAAEKHRRFGIPYRLSRAYEISEADWTEMIQVFENAGVRTRIGG